ncbi:MAG: ADP-ribosylglycohydrolase family protein [Planctomycetota bacterium JB042]
MPEPTFASRVRGCFLGGAVGDALGAPIEFASLDEIVAAHGIDGPADLGEAFGVAGAITDDTQMTMFTVEGMLRALVRHDAKGICFPVGVVHHAYLRWLHTQGERSEHPLFAPEEFDGWLIELGALHARRAPGATCLSALTKAELGTKEAPVNDSKGCGGVMRVAPLGFLAVDPFGFACEVAALTHGHPTGWLAAGFFAGLVGEVATGRPLGPAIVAARAALLREEGHEETLAAVDRALEHADLAPPLPESLPRLGEGWVAEEALALALFCALSAEGFEDGVRLAVTHGGDSDSTGAMTGALLGALLGEEAIPARWLEAVELGDAISTLADDVVETLRGRGTEALSWERYPGW